MDKIRRSVLFIPGDRPNMLQNSGVFGSDSIILDLEDAVNIREKDSARILIKHSLKSVDFNSCEKIVRINPFNTELGRKDLNEIFCEELDGIMVPKVDEEMLKKLHEVLNEKEVEISKKSKTILIPIIESAYALENIRTIGMTSSRIKAILLGGEDYTADIEVQRTSEGEELNFARNRTALFCRANNIDALDTPYVNTENIEGFIKDIKKGKKFGMTGKAAINPRQISDINTIYSPSKEEIDNSKKIIQAYEKAKKENKGVFSLQGKMVDAPIVLRAEKVLNKAKKSNMI